MSAHRPVFEISMATLEEINDLTVQHFKAVNEAVTERWPDLPDMAYTLAIGLAVGALLKSLPDPEAQAEAVNGLNIVMSHTGYVVTPVT